MTPLPPYEHLELRPEEEYPDTRSADEILRDLRRPRPSRAVIGWLLVSLAVVLLVTVSVALFLRWFGA